jgi:hypothetical protein
MSDPRFRPDIEGRHHQSNFFHSLQIATLSQNQLALKLEAANHQETPGTKTDSVDEGEGVTLTPR